MWDTVTVQGDMLVSQFCCSVWPIQYTCTKIFVFPENSGNLFNQQMPREHISKHNFHVLELSCILLHVIFITYNTSQRIFKYLNLNTEHWIMLKIIQEICTTHFLTQNRFNGGWVVAFSSFLSGMGDQCLKFSLKKH